MSKSLHRVSNNIKVITGYPFNSNLFNVDGRGVPLVRIRDLLSKTPEVSFDGPVDSQYMINQGDVLIGMDGEFNLATWKGCRAALNQRVMLLKELPNSEINLKYFSYFLVSFLKDIENKTPQTTVKHLSHLEISNSEFLLPSYYEQQKIAQILTSIDEKIESTEKLIEKKVSLRSGMLVNFFSQQSEELLGNIANVTMGQSPSSTTVSDNLEDGLPFLQGCAEFTRVHPKPLKSCFGEGKRASSKSVLISVRAPVGDTNIADREYVIGRGLAAIFPKVGITPDYLAFAIEFSKQKLNRVAQGSTFEAVGSQDILGLRINFHSDPSKRNKVSNILSSISGDIENNISLLEKLKLQKQGLMQDLLTGKVRVN